MRAVVYKNGCAVIKRTKVSVRPRRLVCVSSKRSAIALTDMHRALIESKCIFVTTYPDTAEPRTNTNNPMENSQDVVTIASVKRLLINSGSVGSRAEYRTFEAKSIEPKIATMSNW